MAQKIDTIQRDFEKTPFLVEGKLNPAIKPVLLRALDKRQKFTLESEGVLVERDEADLLIECHGKTIELLAVAPYPIVLLELERSLSSEKVDISGIDLEVGNAIA